MSRAGIVLRVHMRELLRTAVDRLKRVLTRRLFVRNDDPLHEGEPSVPGSVAGVASRLPAILRQGAARMRPYAVWIPVLLLIATLAGLWNLLTVRVSLPPYAPLYIRIILVAVFVAACTVYLVRPQIYRSAAAWYTASVRRSWERIAAATAVLRQSFIAWWNRFRAASNKDRFLMIRIPLLLAVLFILIRTFGPGFLPPKMTVSFPGDESQEAPLDTTIEIIFDRGMFKPLAEKAFSISPEIPGKLSWEGNQKLIFTPDAPLTRAASYTVQLHGMVVSDHFIPYLGKKTIVFSTIGNPTVVLASPTTETLEAYAPVTVVFDRPMVPLTTATNSAVRRPAFTIEPEVPGEGRWLGTTAYQFRPSQPYRRATTYTVTVPGGITSEDGGIMEKPYTWQFSGERPRVEAFSPDASSRTYASVTASVAAFFNQDLDPKSAEGKIILYDDRKNPVAGRTVVSRRTLAFYPSQPLSREKSYSVVVKKGVRSVEGPNGMEEDATWSLTTIGKPGVIGTSPKQGAENVQQTNSISVQFRTPMDEDSFGNNVIISPAPDIKPSIYFSSYNTRHELNIGTYLGRSREYTVTVGAGVTDLYGTPLGTPYTFTFKTAPYKPAISIYPSGTYFGAFNQKVVPRIVTQVTNADAVSYTLYRITRDDFLELYNRRYGDFCYSQPDRSGCANWQSYDPSKLTKINSWNETYEAELNTPVHVVTKVTGKDGGPLPSGLYYLDAQIAQGPHDNMVMIVTDSTLTVKRSKNQIFVWSVDQSTANVIPGMQIEVTTTGNRKVTGGTTNGDGVFMKDADLSNERGLLVFGTKGNDMVVAADSWSEGINRYDFGLPSFYDPNQYGGNHQNQDYKLYLVPDRPIYRPGNTVYFKGVLRKDNDGAYETVSPDDTVKVNVADARGRSVYSKNLPLSTYGTFSGELTLSPDANLGNYRIESGFRGFTYSQQIQVEEYRKPELSVSVTPSKSYYLQGETADIGVTASYYFGAPVADAPLSYTVMSSDYSFRWQKDRRFEFGNPDDYWGRWWYWDTGYSTGGSVVTQGKRVTDAKGEVALSLPLDIRKSDTDQRMIVETVVNDINNQSVAASQEFIVHKSSLYTGVRPVSYTNRTGHDAAVEVVTLDAGGTEQPDIPVTVDFYRRTWQTVREQDPDTGTFYYTSKPQDTPVAQTSVTTDSLARAVASFTPEEGGTYKAVARATDAAGREASGGSFLWVSGSGFASSRDNNDRIVLVTDKTDYLVGEDMSLFVASPFASESARTLITAERGSVIDYKVVDTSDISNNHVIPVTGTYTPNIFIGAVLVRGGSDVKKPAEFKVGYTQVNVTDRKNQVDVVIRTDKKRYRPGDTLSATIETKDKLGSPVSAELAVGLVDKAIWDLSPVVLPEIYQSFYQPRNLEVDTAQLLTLSMDRINANTNLGAKGGSGGGCFTGDTSILMKGGITKTISEVRAGDTVLTKSEPDSVNLAEGTVTETFKHTVPYLVIINGELRVTPEHILYVNGGWHMAGDVKTGDTLVTADSRQVRVFSVERLRGSFTVYNLHIGTYHTFIAGGFYVHNDKGGFDTSRNNFLDTAYWNAHLVTGKDGKATISVKLPDNLTTWRLSAIANTDKTAFGSATGEVLVTRDVLIRPFLPRFLSSGDKAALGGIISNTSGSTQTMTVSIRTQGLQVSGPPSQNVTITDGQQAKVLWQTETGDTDEVTVSLQAKTAEGMVSDAVTTKLPVISYFTPETVATAGQAKDTAQEKILLPTDIVPDRGSGTVSFSPSLGAGSITAMPYLLDYPYYCTEQITSRLLPSALVSRVLTDAKLEAVAGVTVKQLSATVNDAVQRLNNTQHADGGWGWWIESDSDPYMSAYAYIGLIEAKRSGYTVADGTLSRAGTYLRNTLSADTGYKPQELRAFILYALGGDDALSASYASALYANRFELSLTARAYLAVAMHDLPGTRAQGERLVQELTSLAKKTSTGTHWEENRKPYWYFGDNTMTTATVLEAMSLYNRKNPLIPEVIRYLLASRTGDHWGSTRDTTAVLKSVTQHILAAGDQKVDEAYKLELNGAKLTDGTLTKEDLLNIRQYTVDMRKLPLGKDNLLKITKSGTGNLYYNIDLAYYLPFTEVSALERGLVVVRELVDGNGTVLPADTITENTETWIRLIIVAPEERHYVMIEDRLPAGLESVNESLKNVSTLNVDRPGVKDKGNRPLYFRHTEFHDDRTTLFAEYLPAGVYEMIYRVRATTPGVFHHPPADAHQMYFPDVSGHSDGGWFTVTSSR